MQDTLALKGIFKMQVWSAKTGELLEEYEDNNLVVNLGRTAVMKLLGGETTGNTIGKIAFGTNSTAPAATDTAITGAFSKALGTRTYPTISSVRWAWALEAAENNGMGIREFGLLTANDTLFARKTREVINKTVDIRLSGTWEIRF